MEDTVRISSLTAYYNEIDPHAAAWLRELIAEGHIADGIVDTRSIEDVTPNDLDGFVQCHFFAGIGGWSLALRLASWPDSRPIWTGSCPCQPFSTAGKGAGFADERHLWPAFYWLISQCRPGVIFGEQVASALPWVDLVQGDLEAERYTFGKSVLGAHSVGAPHIRQRLYWVAYDDSGGWSTGGQRGTAVGHRQTATPDSRLGELAHGGGAGLEVIGEQQARGQQPPTERSSSVGQLGDTSGGGSGRDSGALSGEEGSAGRSLRSELDQSELASLIGELGDPESEGRPGILTERAANIGERSRPWGAVEWLPCRDGKSRPVEAGTFPLAHGIPGRVGLLRGYGNAIVPQVAAVFIEAFDTLDIM